MRYSFSVSFSPLPAAAAAATVVVVVVDIVVYCLFCPRHFFSSSPHLSSGFFRFDFGVCLRRRRRRSMPGKRQHYIGPTRRPNHSHRRQCDRDAEAETADNTIFVCHRLWTQSETRASKLCGKGNRRWSCIHLVCIETHSHTHTNGEHIRYYYILYTDIYYVVNVFKPDLAYDLIRYNVSSSTMSPLSSCEAARHMWIVCSSIFGSTMCAQRRIGYHLRRRVISGLKSTRWSMAWCSDGIR